MKVKVSVKVASNLKLQSLHDDGENLKMPSNEPNFVSGLLELLTGKDVTLEELAMLYCYKHGVSINQVLQKLGIEERFANFISRQAVFSCRAGRVTVCCARPPPGLTLPPKASKTPQTKIVAPDELKSSSAMDPTTASSEQYLELHTKISGRAFSSKATQSLNDITSVLTEKLFLNIDHVTRGGSVGRGTVVGGATDAEIVFFLKGLPVTGQLRWLPALHRAVVGVLSENVGSTYGIEDVHALTDCVRLSVRGVVSVDLKFVPSFDCISDVYHILAKEEPESRRRLSAALVRERTHFISKQPGQVKVTMRLMKWWRDQQKWCNLASRPSDDLIELLTVYSAIQVKPHDQQVAVKNVLALMAKFDELCIMWSNFYKKADIWEPLLQQRPLIMDPVNPYVNVADPQQFDFKDLMTHARRTNFFC